MGGEPLEYEKLITKETKEAIAKQYLAGRYNEDIMTTFDISKQDLYNILEELHIPRKVIKKSYKKCPVCKQCKNKVVIRSAKFCPYCGSPMVTKEKVLEILADLKSLVNYIPTGIDKKYDESIEYVKFFVNKMEE